jgi:hypothetical protein
MTSTDSDIAVTPPERPPPEQAGSLLGDIGNLFLAPGRLFADLPRWNRSGSALLVLMLLHVAYACALISTGVPDYEIGLAAQKAINRVPEPSPADDNADDINRKVTALEKGVTFNKLLTRILMIVGGPVSVLLRAAVVASLLFVIVALSGGAKPDFQLLAAIAVFAAYVEVPRMLVRLVLIAQLHALRVETSAAAFLDLHAGLLPYLVLRRLDPFVFWYWGLICLGVWKTGQLSGRSALITVAVLALLAAVVTAATVDLGDLADLEKLLEPK